MQASKSLGARGAAVALSASALFVLSSPHAASAQAQHIGMIVRPALHAGARHGVRPNNPPTFFSYSFPAGGLYGANPESGVINVAGTLYGVTSGGGANCAGNQYCGTIYKINPLLNPLSENVVYSFPTAQINGSFPITGLLHVGPYLYGTTYRSANTNCYFSCGTIFRVKPSGLSPQTLFTFGSVTNGGESPNGNLVKVSGPNSSPTILGMTQYGGQNQVGSLFTYSSGNAPVFHDFGAPSGDGQWPAHVIKVGTNYYGTTLFGGDVNCGPQASCGHGTVFMMNSTGSYVWKHIFNGNNGDGQYPFGGVVRVGQWLYGTTNQGGMYNQGTIFKIKASDGTGEQVIYSFQQGFQSTNGYLPTNGLTYDNATNTLYGTTSYGGGTGCAPFTGCGTIFSYALSGQIGYSTLHSFTGPPEGETPDSELLDIGGTLYGTTPLGGAGGNGTVFYLTP